MGSRILGVHVSTIYNWVKKKKIKGFKVKDNSSLGFHYEVEKSAVEKMRKPLEKAKKRYQKRDSTTPAAQATRKYRQRVAEAREALLDKGGKGFTPEPDVEYTQENGFQTNVSFAYGFCLSWLQNYATAIEMPVKALSEQVGELLRKGGK